MSAEDNIIESGASVAGGATPIYAKGAVQKQIRVYSAQKYAETGNGTLPAAFDARDPEVETKIAAFRQKVKDDNAEYKRRKKNGEIIEPKWRKPSSDPADTNSPRQRTPIADQQLPQSIDPASDQPLFHSVITKFELKLDGRTGNTMYVIGSSKRGKSTAIMKIYDKYYADTKSISILWTVNPQAGVYRKHRKLIVADKFDKESEQLIQDQQRIQKRTKNEYKFLNIFDDILHVRGSKLMENLIMTYRNSNISSIISMQYSNQLQKNCRANVNNVLLFGMNTDEGIEVVIRTYLTGYLKRIGITKMPDQVNWYHKMTADHAFIYVKPADNLVSFHRFDL